MIDGEIFVRKEIEYTSMNTHERMQTISELRILRELNHPNIVKYYSHEHFLDRKLIHIYMEYCEGGDLAHCIKRFKSCKERVPETFIWKVLIQILLALHKCHYGIDAPKDNLLDLGDHSEPTINNETVIIHRDIKPDNIFLTSSDKTIKLGDFGLAKMITSQNDFAKTYVGTPYYMSPEVLMDNPYTPVCDIWSLGCVIYELCTLQPPFQAKTHLQLQTKIKQGVLNPLPTCYSSQLQSVVDQCIVVDPNERASCFDLLQMLTVKFVRKELELQELVITLKEFQEQLTIKNGELKKKEQYLGNLERKLQLEQETLDEKYESMQRKLSLHKKQFEEDLLEEFEARKKQMDLELKEVRLGYQREFKLVVEQEVQFRVKEYLAKQQQQQQQQQPYNGDTGLRTASLNPPVSHNVKLKGPKDLTSEEFLSEKLQLGVRRTPLKARNEDHEFTSHSSAKLLGTGGGGSGGGVSPTRYHQMTEKRRVTDEMERMTLDKRCTPDFDEVYLRRNARY
ncbi:G2-specific serine/threonine protein kinase [Scheffersomyces spartinae]|uniref:non-specific serine/threonine protein kinase n=1 Tax=Scheffersomyces spartinae TaxID=45513 RepID=A0A9P8AHR0_9ASCO|nr:G2-specific serine/threonine protein kinase [Scheffersomyces spartinae]KAG7193632.1 G2-specific serine/threonine protein kinase [Scheffersomyces spartinae]